MPRAEDVILPRNQWYYQYERKPIFDQAGSEGGATGGNGDEQQIFRSGGKLNIRTGDIISWASFLAILITIDVVWFVHRMARTYSTTKMILYGCPIASKCTYTHDVFGVVSQFYVSNKYALTQRATVIIKLILMMMMMMIAESWQTD